MRRLSIIGCCGGRGAWITPPPCRISLPILKHPLNMNILSSLYPIITISFSSPPLPLSPSFTSPPNSLWPCPLSLSPALSCPVREFALKALEAERHGLRLEADARARASWEAQRQVHPHTHIHTPCHGCTHITHTHIHTHPHTHHAMHTHALCHAYTVHYALCENTMS